MKIDVRYDASSIEIEGTGEVLRELAQQISQCAGTCRISLAGFPERNERGLLQANSITILVDAGFVNISQVEGSVVISGSKEKLIVLAQNIEWLGNQLGGAATTETTDHIHIEYHPAHFFLAEGAMPVILARKEND